MAVAVLLPGRRRLAGLKTPSGLSSSNALTAFETLNVMRLRNRAGRLVARSGMEKQRNLCLQGCSQAHCLSLNAGVHIGVGMALLVLGHRW
jgi:hypothetical protein